MAVQAFAVLRALLYPRNVLVKESCNGLLFAITAQEASYYYTTVHVPALHTKFCGNWKPGAPVRPETTRLIPARRQTKVERTYIVSEGERWPPAWVQHI
jgi:hypothetical protein